MPRGYYLGQGLIPLGYSSSDDEEGPCTLPNGRIVCGPHGLVHCGRCCTDYSVMNDLLDEEDDEEDDDEDWDVEDDQHEQPDEMREDRLRCMSPGDEMVRGTGKVFPTKFVPSNSNKAPLDEFPNRRRHMNAVRRTHHNDNTKVLLMTDGACLNNGKSNPRAGWAFYQGENINREPSVVTGRLEKRGPWGDEGGQTSNRAELRAVIAALGFRYWRGEGFKTVVIATDSSYIVDGATQWAKSWVKNGWKTAGVGGSGGGADVKNKDLWEMLLGECEKAQSFGLAIQFWHIPREWNALADAGAKKGATEGDAAEQWVEVHGLAI
ncbi:RNase H domain-containing protein [Diaporthe helianthi]|uniref:ribonuclease H n=1 Tax=Diaporthe helianthi TaxID=158607 RepID=A0A2P5HNV1_DIAHE|nr:RNase H domain-containing protein [Diaporthe helianthi]